MIRATASAPPPGMAWGLKPSFFFFSASGARSRSVNKRMERIMYSAMVPIS